MESLAKEKIVQQALGEAEALNMSPSKIMKSKPTRTEERDDMFKLPPLEDESDAKKLQTELSDDEDEDDLCPKRSYDVNINQIDVTSTHFKSLPADIRHDILTDIKETRKQNSWGRLRELPVESNDFSTYQMSRLLRRRQVQIGLEAAEKEMGGKCWSLSELESLLSEDGVLDINDKAQKIASDANSRFLLVRDIAKAMSEAKKDESAKPSTSKVASDQPSTSKDVAQSVETIDDEDLDLQRAIQLSLGNEPCPEPSVTDGRIKMNNEQRQKFSGTIQAHGLIRGFMMEYAEMNGDDIQDLMEATQVTSENSELNDSFRSKFPNTDEYVLYGTPKKNKTVSVENSEPNETPKSTEVSSDSDSDDLVEVIDKPLSKNASLENVLITVDSTDLKNFSQENDFFADVFDCQETNAEDNEIAEKEIPDVEVASISSDDDTLPYEISQKDLENLEKETESGFVSEEGKVGNSAAERNLTELQIIQDDTEKPEENLVVPSEEVVQTLSVNENFWGEVDKHASTSPKSSLKELSENEKFWAEDVVEISSDDKLKTPVKLNRDNSPPPAKVASPFFVNRKTPSSKKKNIESPIEVCDSAKKLLFPEEKAAANRNAASELRAHKTVGQLEEMKYQLADEQKNLAQEKNKLDRMGANITESMSRDCKELLKLFGIPYIDSPMEAEAQCAFLNLIDLTDGTISDDSDIWLFGGKTVYKNFFVQKKIVMEFRNENIEQLFHLDRQKLIQLAMLVGSDYTVGIAGVGAVTALEILAAFPPTQETEGETDHYQSLVSSLRKFREWFQTGKQPGPNGKTILKSKLKNVELFEGFPNLNVARAYLEPIVDTNAEKFTWGLPDTESLIEYAKAKLGWTRLKTEEIMAPVMKRLNEKKQATIKDYFKSQVTKKFFDNKALSKRVQKAVGKMGGDESEDEKEKPKKAQKRKATAKKKIPTKSSQDKSEEKVDDLVVLSSDDESKDPPEKKVTSETIAPVASTSKVDSFDEPNLFKARKPKTSKTSRATALRKRKSEESEPSTSAANPISVKKRAPRIPETKQIIPQREKDKEEQEKIKQKAIEIFKKSNNKKK